MAHWDAIARKRDSWRGMGRWYHNRLREIYSFHVNPGQKVLEIGCAEGHLLAALQPSRGLGVDFSEEMIRRARQNYPQLEFLCADAHDLSQIHETFDVIVLSDLANDLWDVQRVFEQLQRLCHPRTRILMNFYSRLWQGPLSAARTLNLATSNLYQNWLTRDDINALLVLAGFETITGSREVLWPLPLGGFFNRFLVRLWPFNHLALSNFLIARPAAEPVKEPPFVSVVIAARNEFGQYQIPF